MGAKRWYWKAGEISEHCRPLLSTEPVVGPCCFYPGPSLELNHTVHAPPIVHVYNLQSPRLATYHSATIQLCGNLMLAVPATALNERLHVRATPIYSIVCCRRLARGACTGLALGHAAVRNATAIVHAGPYLVAHQTQPYSDVITPPF